MPTEHGVTCVVAATFTILFIKQLGSFRYFCDVKK
jgi:hypothetical protein